MPEEAKKYRLVTRSDFDGLVCAALLKEMDLIDDIKFVHPKDMQDGLIEITDKDITTNLPFVEGVHLAFDHHHSETLRIKDKKPNYINDPDSPSTARVVYNYYGGKEKFPFISDEMMVFVDRADSAQYTRKEVLNPTGWSLLSFVLDARTGLGRFRNFRISNYNLMMDLIDYCRKYTIDEILQIPDVKERVDLYVEHGDKFKEQIKKYSEIYGNVLVVDLRDEEIIYTGNRFVKYALFPQCNISVQVIWGLKKQNTVFTVGKSIFNKTSKINIGELMFEYSGGRHANAGTCQVPNEKAGELLQKVIEQLKD